MVRLHSRSVLMELAAVPILQTVVIIITPGHMQVLRSTRPEGTRGELVSQSSIPAFITLREISAPIRIPVCVPALRCVMEVGEQCSIFPVCTPSVLLPSQAMYRLD